MAIIVEDWVSSFQPKYIFLEAPRDFFDDSQPSLLALHGMEELYLLNNYSDVLNRSFSLKEVKLNKKKKQAKLSSVTKQVTLDSILMPFYTNSLLQEVEDLKEFDTETLDSFPAEYPRLKYKPRFELYQLPTQLVL